MFMSPRPSIGWLGYYVLGKSPVKMIAALLVLGLISYLLLERSKKSITLQFTVPVPGATTIMFLPPPRQSTIGPFDACAVEAALNSPLPDAAATNEYNTRPVYLYLWFSNVGPHDVWVQRLAKMKQLKILYMNLVQSLRYAPNDGMVSSGGWGGRPGWAIWLASGVSLLWRSGGILLPTGVLITKPFDMEAYGSNTGILVTYKDTLQPIAIGSPTHHPIITNILEKVKLYNASSFWGYANEDSVFTSEAASLLTEAALQVCQVSSLAKLSESRACQAFKIIDMKSSVFEVGINTDSSMKMEKVSFLRYVGDPDAFNNLGWAKSFFRRHALLRYCPEIYKFLEQEAKYYA